VEGRPIFVLVEASGDCIPVADGVADVILLGNAIHCFMDKAKLLKEVCRVLRPSGLFAFNSSFYAGTMVKGTEKFYEEWMKYALHHLRGVSRSRGCGRPAFSNRWLTPAEYSQLLSESGLDVVGTMERVVQMSRRNFETVGAYSELASVLLSGYPVKLACEALEKAVGQAFEAVRVETVPRSWLEAISVKR
jgi:ubiquinone/menaquinone biosynthesis C-methylase UbiE